MLGFCCLGGPVRVESSTVLKACNSCSKRCALMSLNEKNVRVLNIQTETLSGYSRAVGS